MPKTKSPKVQRVREARSPENSNITLKGRTKYLTNAAMLEQLRLSHAQGKPTQDLCRMLMLLAKKRCHSPMFRGYSFVEDMEAEAIVNLYRNWNKFDITRDNPFAYFTTAITNSCFAVMNQEKMQREIRDALLIQEGANPSWNYTDAQKEQA